RGLQRSREGCGGGESVQRPLFSVCCCLLGPYQRRQILLYFLTQM
ncbi:mCG1037840, isoform CRA_b, partial [Mus musculus]